MLIIYLRVRSKPRLIPDAKLGSSPGLGGSGIPRTTKSPMAAVMTAKGNVAASSKLILSGIWKVVEAGATVYSWYAPYWKPKVSETVSLAALSSYFSSPCRHLAEGSNALTALVLLYAFAHLDNMPRYVIAFDSFVSRKEKECLPVLRV